MLKFLIQKKVILVLLLFSLCLFLVFSVENDWLKKPAFLDGLNKNLIKKLNKVSQVLAQEYVPYFFPHFPQRLIYLLSNEKKLNEELIRLNEELKKEVEKSDCKFAFSECLPRITPGGTGCQSVRVLGSSYENSKKIEEKKEEIADRIDDLSFLKGVLEKERESGGLPEEMKTLRKEVADELNENLEKTLNETEKIISAAMETLGFYNKDYTNNCIAQCSSGPVCGVRACAMLGTGPQKQIKIKANVEVGLDDLQLGEAGIDKFGLALPDKLNFPRLGDITITIPQQTLEVCFPLQPVTVSAQPPSFGNLPNLSFSCPTLSLNLPQWPIPKLPSEFRIPFKGIPEIKWCPEVPEGNVDSEQIRREQLAAIEREMEEFKNKINEKINEIDEKIREAPEETKNELRKNKEALQEEYERVKEKIPQRQETPPTEFETPSISKEHPYQSPKSKGLELRDVSLSYQCSQTSGEEKVTTKAETNWYFETLSWLMEKCANLPTMSNKWGLKEKVAGCYSPDKVVETIINECGNQWSGYCSKMYSTEDKWPKESNFPAICRYTCKPEKENIAAAVQCQNLFKQEKLEIPSECRFVNAKVRYVFYIPFYYCPKDYPVLRPNDPYQAVNHACLPENFNPTQALENKCQELKDKYPEPEKMPEPCKILPLLKGKIETPGSATYSGSKTSCPAQKIFNLPFGLGGGIGFNCPTGSPIPPKIVLPDIVIPDIILPEFSVPPFLRVKLPSIIIEDLILPDIELCDLNKCANIFPYLQFTSPRLNLPSLDLSVEVPQLPGLILRTRMGLPSFNFPLPRINLFNLLLPELKLPEIPLPLPKINFAITGIDLSAIFDYIFTFLLNALDIPDFGFCLNFQIPSTFLSIVFPDYYLSFGKFPEIPKIPFCDDIDKFCDKVKETMGKGGWQEKAKEIEKKFGEKIDKVQKELDKISGAVKKAEDAINEVFKDIYGPAIVNAIREELEKKGLSLEDYMNPETQEIDLSKIPFPGVFPIKATGRTGESECLLVPTPEVDIVLRIVNKKDHPEIKEVKIEKELSHPPYKFIIYVPVDIPVEIPLDWPKELKEINLDCDESACHQCRSAFLNECQKKCQKNSSGEPSPDAWLCTVECYHKAYTNDGCKNKCQKCLSYEIPPIPLSGLSYKKEIPIKTVGFQPRTFLFDFGKANEGDCLAEPPTGGNPFPLRDITEKLNVIKDIQSAIDSASQKIIKILQ